MCIDPLKGLNAHILVLEDKAGELSVENINARDMADARSTAELLFPEFTLKLATLPPAGFQTEDGYTLIKMGDSWTDGDLSFDDLAGSPIDDMGDKLFGTPISYEDDDYKRMLCTLVEAA